MDDLQNIAPKFGAQFGGTIWTLLNPSTVQWIYSLLMRSTDKFK